jgi:hypothetical protein
VNATVLLTAVDINIPGYRILRPIGEGGMASVFLAVQESLDREVALKVMSPALAANSEFSSRFLTEGKITAKLQHPNLVTVYDIGTHAGVYYLAAEYIPGGTLKDRISEGGLSMAEILDIIADIALGLDFAHQKGFVHRDVKPGNVLFRNDGRVVLADFGIAKAMDGSNSSTVAGASIGTPDYMSPEQARGEAVDGRSDLYSLGTVLYEMLLGHAPYQASDPFTVALMHVTHPVPTLPEEYSLLQPLLNGMMAKQPAERYNTGAAVVEAIHKLVAEAPESAKLHQSSARKAGTAQRLSGGAATQQRTRVNVASGKQADSRRGVILAAALAGVAVIGVAVWKFWPSAEPPVTVDGTVTTTTDTPTVDTSHGQAGGILTATLPTQDPAALMSAEDIETALTQADTYLDNGTNKDLGRQLTFPDDDSALGLYRKVLAAQPDNPRARSGIAAIVAFFRKMSHKACRSGLWVQCRIHAQSGLDIDPADETLIRLNAAADAGERGETPALPTLPGN